MGAGQQSYVPRASYSAGIRVLPLQDEANIHAASSKTPQARPITVPSTPAADIFRDRDWAPLMSVIPAGRFIMGSAEDERGRGVNEGPQHEVVIEKPFAIGVFPVTCREFAPFAQNTSRKSTGALMWTGFEMAHLPEAHWDNPGFPQGDMHPATCINFEDAHEYTDWLRKETGRDYRLPTEAEWEYAARAGTTTAYWWGQNIISHLARYDRGNPGSAINPSDAGTGCVATSPPNPWGIHDVLGNVWEWCEDTWHESYLDAPSDGSAWVGYQEDRRIVRGGSWSADANVLRCAQRRWINVDNRMINVGLRVALSL